MTPKEKALELINLFKPIVFGNSNEVEDYNASLAAQIAVGLRLESDFLFNDIKYGESSREYWEQVKTEIECL
jgi:hypothetical protein